MIAKNDRVISEKTTLEGNLHDLLAQKQELDLKIEKLEVEAERCRNEMNTHADAMVKELLCKSLNSFNERWFVFLCLKRLYFQF